MTFMFLGERIRKGFVRGYPVLVLSGFEKQTSG